MSKAYVSAVAMLARREHGAFELRQKLEQKGYLDDEIVHALAECQRLGLQSDERFVASFCRKRIRQGYGPRRIMQDLQQVQIEPSLIEQIIAEERDNWEAYASDVWRKKYKAQTDPTFIEQQKQKQFLLYRGFTPDIINNLFKKCSL